MEEIKLQLPKNEKLKSSTAIQNLFKEGKSIVENNVKILYLPSDILTHQIAFTVPKKNFKLAKDRNRIKRQMRETYRLNKLIINDLQPKHSLFLMYLGKKKPKYNILYQDVQNILKTLSGFKP